MRESGGSTGGARSGTGSMKKNCSGKRGAVDSAPQNIPPDKVGWIRKYCGKGIFREIWKNRFVVLRGDQLFVCQKEVKELGRADEVLDLTDYERCEDIKKNKSRSKKSHSKFRLQRCSSPGNMVPNLVFLAVSPEEKESWINVLNAAITRAKNRILDEVTVEDSQLSHLTRDRVKIPHNRRLPTRGHLLAVASTSSSDGMLTLDLIQEDGCEPFRVDLDKSPLAHSADCPHSKMDGALSAESTKASGKSQSLPRQVPVVPSPESGKRLTASEKNRCVSVDQILMISEAKPSAGPLVRLQELIERKLQETELLLSEARVGGERVRTPEGVEAERLLKEATAAWKHAQEVLEEVKELRALCRQLDSVSPSNGTTLRKESPSLM